MPYLLIIIMPYLCKRIFQRVIHINYRPLLLMATMLIRFDGQVKRVHCRSNPYCAIAQQCRGMIVSPLGRRFYIRISFSKGISKWIVKVSRSLESIFKKYSWSEEIETLVVVSLHKSEGFTVTFIWLYYAAMIYDYVPREFLCSHIFILLTIQQRNLQI